jgi:predicted choloylglycine hydrolase
MKPEFSEKTLVESSFIHVRHLVLRGSNYEIGQKLAKTALSDFGLQKKPAADPIKARAQRAYMQQNYPVHYERMQGAAAAMGLDFEDNTYDFSYLNTAPGLPGCSTVFYPPTLTNSGHPILSRNFDFTTGTLMATPPSPGEAPAAARPYLVEVYPDKGYPSLYLCSFEMLGGCTDGINSEGLVVALNADAESGRTVPMQPTFGNAVGVNEIQLARLLLDTCASVEEAQQMLLKTKQYYMFAPCHYLIADRYGNSFVWEYSPVHNTEYIIEGKGQAQILTNHLLCKYSSAADLPIEEFGASSYTRYRTLLSAIGQTPQPHSLEQIKANNRAVFITDRSYPHPQQVPDRTIWHSIYDCSDRSMEVCFYMNDDPAQGEPVYSKYLRFQLENTVY